MEHFKAIVITSTKDGVKDALQPFHSFEYDNIDDEYVRLVKPDETMQELEQECMESNASASFEQWLTDCGYTVVNGEAFYYTNPNTEFEHWQLDEGLKDLLGNDCAQLQKKDLAFMPKVFSIVVDGKWHSVYNDDDFYVLAREMVESADADSWFTLIDYF